MQLQIISQSLGTLYSDQNGLPQLSAEAHCQPVCPCARPVIGWPGICDEGSASPEDVSCPSCKTHKEEGKMGVINELWHNNNTLKESLMLMIFLLFISENNLKGKFLF